MTFGYLYIYLNININLKQVLSHLIILISIGIKWTKHLVFWKFFNFINFITSVDICLKFVLLVNEFTS